MPLFCSAFGCSNLSSKKECKQRNVSFHSFPLKKPELLKRWLVNVRREGFVPKEHSRLCSDHFEEGSFAFQPFTNKRFLKADALPTIFNYNAAPKKRKRLMFIRESCKEEEVISSGFSHSSGVASSSVTETEAMNNISDKPKLYLIRCNPQNGVVVTRLENDGAESLLPEDVASTSEQFSEMSSERVTCHKRKACENCEEAAERRHKEQMQKWDRFLTLMEELVDTLKSRNADE